MYKEIQHHKNFKPQILDGNNGDKTKHIEVTDKITNRILSLPLRHLVIRKSRKAANNPKEQPENNSEKKLVRNDGQRNALTNKVRKNRNES